MPTKRKITARAFLEDLAGGPLTLGRLLRAIRQGEEWSLAEMGKKLKVTRGHVSNVEKGKAVNPETAARYAKALGHSVEQFVRLALQDDLRRAGLKYTVDVRPQKKRSKAS